MPRSDLLEYLERYRATPRRRMVRVERWRRRAWRRGTIVQTADRLAADLHAAGIGEGDRVGIRIKDGPPWAAALFGVLRSGAAAVPIDVAHAPELAARWAARLALAGWVADDELTEVPVDVPRFELGWRTAAADRAPAAAMPSWPSDDPERTAQIVLTSGTTDVPQSVELTHANLRAVLDSLEGEIAHYRWLMRAAPRLRLAVALPLSHLYGQYMGVLLPPLLDADVAMVDTLPAAELAAALRRERAWALASVPHTLSTLARHLLHEGRRAWGEAGLEQRLAAAPTLPWHRRVWLFDPIRRRLGRRLIAVVSGGASLDEETERLWRLLGYIVIQGYGLTEAAPLVTLNHPFRPRSGSVGAPLPGIEVRVAEDGEILVRGGNVAALPPDAPSNGGALPACNPPASAPPDPTTPRGPRVDAEGWLHTGDLGEMLDDGSIRFRGRRCDRIVTPAGVNVDPDEVAGALRATVGVIEAFVLERPWGEAGTPCAVLVVYPGADAGAAVRHANRELPEAARVRRWFVWPHGDLPRTGTGKVRRAVVRAWVAEQAPADAGEAADPVTAHDGSRDGAVDRLLRVLAGGDSTVPSDTSLGELLSSLDRVELGARLESLYGIEAGAELFRADATLADLEATLHAALGHTDLGDLSGSAAQRHHEAQDRRSTGGDDRTRREAPREPEPQRAQARGVAGRGSPATKDPTRPATSPAARPAARPDTRPDLARWRHRFPARAARFVLREIVMHPLARLLVHLDVRSDVPLDELPAPFLLAANHTSYIDPIVMFALPPRLRAGLAPAARWNFFTVYARRRWLYRLAVLGLDLVPLVQRGDWRPTLRIAGELADRGGSVLIYPEGEISQDGELQAFKDGVAVMSRELHLPIVPCATAGLERVMPPGTRRLRRPGRRRPRVAVRIGEPLPALRPDQDLRARVEELEQRVLQLREQARAMMR